MLKNDVTPFQKVKKSIKPSELKGIDYKGHVEAKYDGSRYRIRVKDGEIKIFSKRVSVVTDDFVDKTENFPQFHFLKDCGDMDFDVEMVVGTGVNCRSSHVTKVSGSGYEKAIELQEEFGYLNAVVINWYVYPEDILLTDFFSATAWLIDIMKDADTRACFYLPRRWYVHGTPGLLLEDVYKKSIEEGYEGIMLKEGKYKNAWAKVKKTDTWDYVICGFQDSQSEDFNEKGWIGSIIFGYVAEHKSDTISTCFNINERVVSCKNKLFIGNKILVPCGTCSGFDFSLREKMSQNPNEYIGRVVEIEGQELDKKLGLRHPRFISFRDDKDALECTKESLLRRKDND